MAATASRAGEQLDGMNKAWEAWVLAGHAPARATVPARLAEAQWKIAIIITAAVAR